ncbi:hypothetical protein D9619_006604 [Psilocybe cf. subviscida]|uniref:F-box domain-containing protein n=1 Tax=Psilocybe cf. subviscida TaxID=2480587 RepID=A0A8H5EXE7_9AGAR|nr:hypothetical protein D9619_006604 [Psilocybe cf. subviscida]
MSHFASLPPEIIYHIGSHLSIADNKSLRHVCQYISQVVEPLALFSLTFCLKDSILHLYAKKLNAYAERTTRAAAHVRKLAVISQDQLTDFHHVHAEERRNKTIARYHGTPVAPPANYQQLLEAFLNILLSLDKVITFDWYLDYDMSEPVVSNIFTFVSSPSIKKLKITFNRPALVTDSLVHFDHPWTVRELVLTGFAPIHSARTRGGTVQLAELSRRLIANCPDLEHLSLQTLFSEANGDAPRLHDFLPHDASNSAGITTKPPLRLKSLSMSNLRMHLNQAMLYHLRSLQHLHVRFPLTTPERDGDPISMIMRTLRTEKIHLRGLNLNTPDVENEVIEYLLSYSNTGTIQEIAFENKNERTYIDAQDASIIAERFFGEVLPGVAGSLRSLNITTIDRSDSWSFNPLYSESIKLCHKLESLCLSVDGEANDNAEEVLKATKRHLPRLLSLEIDHIRSVGGGLDITSIW